MAVTGFMSVNPFSTSIEVCFKSPYNLKTPRKPPGGVKLISLGGGSQGTGSLMGSRKIIRRLRIDQKSCKNEGSSNGGYQGFVNSGSRHENFKVGAKTALSPSVNTELNSDNGVSVQDETVPKMSEKVEEFIEKAIFNCRFLTLMAVAGSLAGSMLCFLKGCAFVLDSFKEYFQSYIYHHGSGKVILLLVEAVDVYLMGTVMLIFGMGLYELFVNSLEIPDRNSTQQTSRATVCGSNLFGLFRLQERPKWLEIQSLDELKTKLGHVIVMVLLVGMFEKSKKVPINSGLDLLCFSGSVLLSSGSLFLLSKLNAGK